MPRLIFYWFCLCCLLSAGCIDSTNQKNQEPKTVHAQPPAGQRVAGQYIVVLKETGNSATLTEVFNQYGIDSIKELSKGRYLITLQHDPGPKVISEIAINSPNIDYAQPNYIYRTMPSSPARPQKE